MKKLFFVTLVGFTFSNIFPVWALEQANEDAKAPLIKEASAAMRETDALNAKDPLKEYGLGANPNEAIKISEVLETPEKFLEKDITVSGLIVDVCPKRGCWMLFASDKKFQTLRIKVNDGVMVFPLSARGRQGTAKGRLFGTQLSQERAIKYFKHLADERGEEFDQAGITGPMTIYLLKATGASIK